MSQIMKNLVAHQIPLQGKHLIEASAGTGKTFNITRIYLRLLVEKNLSVEQILVMTFTKDATEELRGRIDSFIRASLQNWQQLIESDDYFKAIAAAVPTHLVKQRLQQALLYLDEAAIFTIHGFCKRVLSQNAFDSGLAFNLTMESSCQELLVEACQDYYRVLAATKPEQFLQLIEFWSQPHSFLKHFNKAINSKADIEVISASDINAKLLTLVNSALASIKNNNDVITKALIDSKTGKARETRIVEFEQLKSLLNQLSLTLQTNADSQAYLLEDLKFSFSFVNKSRFGKYKDLLTEIFYPLFKVRDLLKDFNKRIAKAEAFVIARDGIYQIRQRFNDKKQQQHILSFDDLIATLASKLSQGQSSKALAEKIYQQYPVALIDEFQDTDPEQFAILSSIYNHQPSAAIYMIGDPKQAIYGFRGGDVFAYLAARDGCDHKWLMDTNWRSSAGMIAAYNRLFYGQALESSKSVNQEITSEEAYQASTHVFNYGIEYSPVKPSPNAHSKLNSLNNSAQALHFVHFEPESEQFYDRSKNIKQGFRSNMAAWCAQEILSLLSNSENALQAQDIAILVRDGSEARDIKNALTERGLACVYLSNRANLLKTEQAKQLLALLKGIWFIENERLYTASLACSLLGITPEKLAQLQADGIAWQQKRSEFGDLRELWLQKGFITMALSLMHDHFVCAQQENDRVLTNLLHLFELLQVKSQQLTQATELLYWFEQQIFADLPEVEAELRLESDDNLIRIITQHGSKGLEYPVVFVPFATRHKDPLKLGASYHTVIEHHDEQKQLHLSLEGNKQAKGAMADEAYAESVRLLYVAITRAEQRCYLLTAEFEQWQKSPLGKTLQGSFTSTDPDQKLSLQSQTLVEQLAHLADELPKEISLTTQNENFEREQLTLEASSKVVTSLNEFTGKIERDWWLSSFTSLSRNLRTEGKASPDRDEQSEIQEQVLAENADETLVAETLPLRFTLAKGAHSGNLLHNILEHCDFTAPSWAELFEKPLMYYGELPQGYQQADLENWLTAVLNAAFPALPVNTNKAGFSLADIGQDKSLREIEFYYPMENANISALTQLLTDHRARVNNTIHQQGKGDGESKVVLPHYQNLKGMMHGFIDLIFEVDGKFYIADHKSNHLGDELSDYNYQNMHQCVQSHFYDLQYLIYSLALHRYLKAVLPNYSPEQHFGGVYYLFLRGMTDSELGYKTNNDALDSGNQVHEQNQTQVQALFSGIYGQVILQEELEQLDQIFSSASNNETSTDTVKFSTSDSNVEVNHD